VYYVLLVYRDDVDGVVSASHQFDGAGGAHCAAGDPDRVALDLLLVRLHAVTTVRGTPGGVIVHDGSVDPGRVPVSRLCVLDGGDLDGALRVAKRLSGSAAAVEVRPAGVRR